MECKRTVQERIKDLRKDKGVTLEAVANATGFTKSAIGYYEDTEGDREISHSGIIAMANYYGVSTDYLLGMTENPKPVTTPVSELHLDDETVELLKSGCFNTRLFCEIVKHPAFRTFMQDVEILIDGHIAMQVAIFNSVVDIVRGKIQEKYDPSEDDTTYRTLEASHIDMFRYFSFQIQEDIETILKDLWDQHSGDHKNYPIADIEAMFNEPFNAAMAFNGSKKEKHALLVLKQLGINYHSITPAEFTFFADIVGKSKFSRSPIRQRGKYKRIKR